MDRESELLALTTPWENNDSAIWMATSMAMTRNLEKFAFPSKLDGDKRKQVLDAASRELLNLKEFEKPLFFNSEQMNPNEKEFLYEHFLTPQTFHQAHSGEGFIVDKTGQFLISINLQDHLQLRIINSTSELEEDWNRLMKIEMELGKAIKYAYSPRFGFMTSNPSMCGTGLVVTAFLQVPALIHTRAIEEFVSSHEDHSIKVIGLQGQSVESTTENIGDLIAIENNYTLGVTEENIISSIRSFSTKLLVLEKSIRNQIRESGDSSDLKDKVSRAYGLLIHSYQNEAVEAMNEISLLKLGLDLGWLSGITVEQLNSLFFNCRRAHLVRHFKQDISQEELPHKRSEFIHQTLKKAKLDI